MMNPPAIRCGIIGFGRIGQLCHAIVRESAVDLSIVAAADIGSNASAAGIPLHRDYLDLLADDNVEAVLVTTPPDSHSEIARAALLAGKDVLLEKPPARTIAEAEDLIAVSRDRRQVLVYGFHAQHNPAVVAAAARLHGVRIVRAEVVFREDARRFHPPGGFAFAEGALRDSGVNAISIVTRLLPAEVALAVTSAELSVPEDTTADTHAIVRFSIGADGTGIADIDTRYSGADIREVRLQTTRGTAQLDIVRGAYTEDGVVLAAAPVGTDMLREEYLRMLTAFASAVRARQSSAGVREVAWIEEALRFSRPRI